MATSGRAGLFTMDDGRFFGDLRGTPYTADKRQKSGALRLEFGQVQISKAGVYNLTFKTTINTGIATILTPTRQFSSEFTSGIWQLGTPGSFVSAECLIYTVATGQFSGMNSGMHVNYMVVGY